MTDIFHNRLGILRKLLTVDRQDGKIFVLGYDLNEGNPTNYYVLIGNGDMHEADFMAVPAFPKGTIHNMEDVTDMQSHAISFFHKIIEASSHVEVGKSERQSEFFVS